MEERRHITRIDYRADSVIVVREDLRKIYGKVKNVSPLGIAVIIPADSPSVLSKDIIIVADTLIMYADVVREVDQGDGTRLLGLNARKFTGEVLQYLFEHIASDSSEEDE